jgi:hypothetical protein
MRGGSLGGQWLEDEAKGGQQEIFMVPMMLPWRNREKSYEGHGISVGFKSFQTSQIGTPSQNWWQTILEIKVPCSQWKTLYRIMRGPGFFLILIIYIYIFIYLFIIIILIGRRREDFFAFFPCSHHVAYVFPWGSQNVPPKRSQ